MKTFEFTIVLTVDADSEEEALERADITMQNLSEMMGHAPFECEIELQDDYSEVEYEEEDENE